MNEQLGQLFMLARVGKRWSQERLAMVEKLAAALKDVQSWLAEHEGLVSIPAEEALAEFEAGKK